MTMPPIPDFLIATEENTKAARAAWKPRKQAKRAKAKRTPFHLPKTIEPAGLKLLREIELEKKQKQLDRLAALKLRK